MTICAIENFPVDMLATKSVTLTAIMSTQMMLKKATLLHVNHKELQRSSHVAMKYKSTVVYQLKHILSDMDAQMKIVDKNKWKQNIFLKKTRALKT